MWGWLSARWCARGVPYFGIGYGRHFEGLFFRKTWSRPFGANSAERDRFPGPAAGGCLTDSVFAGGFEEKELPDASIVPCRKPASNMVITLIYKFIQ